MEKLEGIEKFFMISFNGWDDIDHNETIYYEVQLNHVNYASLHEELRDLDKVDYLFLNLNACTLVIQHGTKEYRYDFEVSRIAPKPGNTGTEIA